MATRVSLFKVLRRELGPQIAARGYAEVSQSASDRTWLLPYFRKAPRGKSRGFFFQRNVKSLWVDALGSRFNLEFFSSSTGVYEWDYRERIYYLLTQPEREEMRILQNNMIKRLPPLETVLRPGQIKLYGKTIKPDRKIVKESFNPLYDPWMRYRDEEDILAWTLFIGRLLPDLTERFELAKRQRD